MNIIKVNKKLKLKDSQNPDKVINVSVIELPKGDKGDDGSSS